MDLSSGEKEAQATISVFRAKLVSFANKKHYRAILVGTKRDVRSKAMSYEKLKQMAVDSGFDAYIETSAKDNHEVEKPFSVATELSYKVDYETRKVHERTDDDLISIFHKQRKRVSSTVCWGLAAGVVFCLSIVGAISLAHSFAS